jgi:hypothetical protein
MKNMYTSQYILEETLRIQTVVLLQVNGINGTLLVPEKELMKVIFLELVNAH